MTESNSDLRYRRALRVSRTVCCAILCIVSAMSSPAYAEKGAKPFDVEAWKARMNNRWTRQPGAVEILRKKIAEARENESSPIDQHGAPRPRSNRLLLEQECELGYCDICVDQSLINNEQVSPNGDYLDFDPLYATNVCYTYFINPDTGAIEVDVQNIFNRDYLNYSAASIIIGPLGRPLGDPLVVGAWSEYPQTSLTLIAPATSTGIHEVWEVYVEYNIDATDTTGDGGSSAPEIEIIYNKRDIDLMINLISVESTVRYLHPEEESQAVYNVTVSSVGADDIPGNWTFDLALYSHVDASCVTYVSSDWCDYETLNGLTVDFPYPLYTCSAYQGETHTVLAVVDPDNEYGASGLELSNNCLQVGTISWSSLVFIYWLVENWEYWEGPGNPVPERGAPYTPVSVYNDGFSYETVFVDPLSYEFSVYIPGDVTNIQFISNIDDEPSHSFSLQSDQFTHPVGRSRIYPVDELVSNWYGTDVSAHDPDKNSVEEMTLYKAGYHALYYVKSAEEFLWNNGHSSYLPLPDLNFKFLPVGSPLIANYEHSTRTITFPQDFDNTRTHKRHMSHEIGHVVMKQLFPSAPLPSLPAGEHHWPEKRTDVSFAFSEGFAEFFSAIVPFNRPLGVCGILGGCNTSNIETNTWGQDDYYLMPPSPESDPNKYGHLVEGVFASILYDLYDNTVDEWWDDTYYGDKITIPFAEMMNYIGIGYWYTDRFLVNLSGLTAASYQTDKACRLVRWNFVGDQFPANMGCDFTDVSIENDDAVLPKSFKVSEPYPNPFNPTTKVNIELPKVGKLDVYVRNILGQTVFKEEFDHVGPGVMEMRLDMSKSNGSELSSGIYFLSVQFEESVVQRKLLFIK